MIQLYKGGKMTSRDFCYWLQGYFEISGRQGLDGTQCQVVKNHLNMVFRHEIDPSMGSLEHQHELNNAHNGIVTNELDSQTVYGC